jgi:hypothetical protein
MASIFPILINSDWVKSRVRKIALARSAHSQRIRQGTSKKVAEHR